MRLFPTFAYILPQMGMRRILAANLSKKPLTVVLMTLLTEVRKEVQSKSLSNLLNRDWRTLLSDN